MGENLKSLVAKRGQIKSKLTKFNNYFHSLTPSLQNIVEIKIRLSKFETCWDDFQILQDEIELLDEAHLEDHVVARDAFESLYFKLRAEVETAIMTLSSTPSTSSSSNASNTSTSNCPADATRPNRIKLPTLSLPEFNGEYENWIPFHDMFEAAINSNENLSDVERFHYLRGSLKGSAADLISSITISGNNYVIAYNLLKERYQNTRLIVNSHLKALFELPMVVKESHFHLRNLLDSFQKHVRALDALGQATNAWDTVLLYLLTTKIDATTKRDWESSIETKNFPKLQEFTAFLTKRCQVLESINTKSVISDSQSKSKPRVNAFVATSNQNSPSRKCPKCAEDHSIKECPTFLRQKVEDRISDAKRMRLCLNCLRRGHYIGICKAGNCKICKKRHSALLHIEIAEQSSAAQNRESVSNAEFAPALISGHCSNTDKTTIVVLATAMVDIINTRGVSVRCRALLDSGSQTCFITQRLSDKLKLKIEETNLAISGINQNVTKAVQRTTVTLRSCTSNYKNELNLLVLPNITENLPSVQINTKLLHIPEHIELADSTFYMPGKIDILLGSEVFWNIIGTEQIKITNNICFQNTRLGWVISGRVPINFISNQNSTVAMCVTHTLERQLQKFCEIETVFEPQNRSPEEKSCESFFKNNTVRDAGYIKRFTVALPFKDDPKKLGNSLNMALRRFHALERKLDRQPNIKLQYSEFMTEYLELGHMELVPTAELGNTPNYYLPHHAVVKSSSTTTKLRVVFDGSAKSSTGYSLNELLMVGPTIQNDLFSIVARWRGHKVVLMGDIAKMYRQIKIRPEDRKFQRIIWRNDIHSPIQTYQLCTVTYGTASASHSAIRCLQQTAVEVEEEFPKIAGIVKRDFYVDDLITGCDSISEAKVIRDQIAEILKTGGFELRKWISNYSEVLTDLTQPSTEPHAFYLDKNENVKLLGLLWNSVQDSLHYSIVDMQSSEPVTKRYVLSKVSQFFDPLGLIGPIIIKAKLFIQALWQGNLGWDELIPPALVSEWNHFVKELPLIGQLKIPRYVLQSNASKIQLHAFCDASERAYGACVYLKSSSEDGSRAYLLCAKSRVAPVKSVSLPRLELSGALLLAKLVAKVRESLAIQIDECFFWTDSMIVLAWIHSPSHHWKTFVGNRVSKIQDLAPIHNWHHVRSKYNPADLLSRGSSAQNLLNLPLWWNGPEWLQLEDSEWPLKCEGAVAAEDAPERKCIPSYTLTHTVLPNFDLFNKFSSLDKLVRIAAYVRRFCSNIKCRVEGEVAITGPLSLKELKLTLETLLKISQLQAFDREINDLKITGSVHRKSRLLTLKPFLDENGLLRVGGRLRNAPVTFAQKFPIVLPATHPITKLLVEKIHLLQLHAGPQALLAATRLEYWPLGAKSLVKKVCRSCLICFKNNPRNVQPMMGDLPQARVTPSRPFTNCGVDYAGPYAIKEGRRSRVTSKAYLVVFICLATKAVHLELVTSLTSESFIATLRRFISRRGKCAALYSDNATNFTGANKELKELAEAFLTENSLKVISPVLNELTIDWHFIPARSPTFGGLWEAAVKSAKHHLKRVLADTPLTFEELYTVITQVESVLNSRPLCPLSDDPSELTALTPGHFLIGDSLAAVAEPELITVRTNRLSRWQHLQKMIQHFWTRWRREYLNNLQVRHKWNTTGSTVNLGQLVLLKDDNLPPMKWPTGRIVKVFPGADNIVRAIEVLTRNGVVSRAVSRVCPLPSD